MSHVDYPKGDPENPVMLGDIVNKFNLLTEKYFDKKKRKKIVEEVGRLEEIDNIDKIANLIS
jgi:2-methylcitrate dehydratase PrpD